MFEAVERLFKVYCCHPQVELPFVGLLLENCRGVEVVGSAVVVSEASLVWALVWI